MDISKEFKPKRGDTVIVSTAIGGKDFERIYLTEIPGAHRPYVCVIGGDEEKFKRGQKFVISEWSTIKPLSPKEYNVKLSENNIGLARSIKNNEKYYSPIIRELAEKILKEIGEL